MLAYRCDNSFEGLLSAVFDAYTQREFPEILLGPEGVPPLTATTVKAVAANRPKADRVFAGLCKRLSREGKNNLLLTFLAEEKEIPSLLFRYIRKVFDAPPGFSVEGDFSDKDILAVDQIARKVTAEVYHLLGFARFQKTAEGMYFSAVSPRHNILSLLLSHFTNRFSSHPWILYDMRRGFGFYAQKGTIHEVSLTEELEDNGMLADHLLAEDEKTFQKTWQQYLKAATITERLNTRLQTRCLPRRFWPYMTEMR